GAVRQLRVMAWGLVPSWAKDRKGAAKLINARAESVASKPAFRLAYAKRRCLIPADGWYEWRVIDGESGPRKQPMYMTPEDGHGLAFAGLYEFWRGRGTDADHLHDHHLAGTGRADGRLRPDAVAAPHDVLGALARPVRPRPGR